MRQRRPKGRAPPHGFALPRQQDVHANQLAALGFRIKGRYLQFHLLSTSLHGHAQGRIARLPGVHIGREIAVDRLVVDRQDHIVCLKARLLGRAACAD